MMNTIMTAVFAIFMVKFLHHMFTENTERITTGEVVTIEGTIVDMDELNRNLKEADSAYYDKYTKQIWYCYNNTCSESTIGC